MTKMHIYGKSFKYNLNLFFSSMMCKNRSFFIVTWPPTVLKLVISALDHGLVLQPGKLQP